MFAQGRRNKRGKPLGEHGWREWDSLGTTAVRPASGSRRGAA